MKNLFTYLFLFISYSSFSQTFELSGINFPELANSTSTLGDFDNDGDMDLYLSGFAILNAGMAGGLYIYDNGSYAASNLLPPVFFGDADWGDMDNDGDLDIAIMGANINLGGKITVVYRNNGDGTFTNLNVPFEKVQRGSIAWVDFDGDSDLDLSYTGDGDFYKVTKLFRNNGDDTFTELSSVNIPGLDYGQIRWADYNNDGNQDFIIAGNDVNPGASQEVYTKLFTGNGDGSFIVSEFEFQQGWFGDIEWVDYNADGNIDVLISGTIQLGDQPFTIMYKNDGNGSFVPLDLGIPGVANSSLEWKDFDLDGDLDLFISGVSGTTVDENISSIFRNDGNDVFTDIGIVGIPSASAKSVAGDIDGDGRPDLVITGFGELIAPTLVFFNTTVVGIDENMKKSRFNIYPNPTSGLIHLSLGIDRERSVKIYNLVGKCIKIINLKSTESTIDLSDLDSGLYLMVADDRSTRFVVE